MSASDLILGFDASTAATAVVLGRADGELICARDLPPMPGRANQASSHLVPAIEASIAQAGVSLRDLHMVAVGRGPGTFTGSRVAVATAKGLALGLGVQTLPVSTLAAVAAGLPEVDEAAAATATQVFGLLDARRGEVYGAAYRWPCLAPVAVEVCVAPDSLRTALALETSPSESCAIGTGVGAGQEVLELAAISSFSVVGVGARGLWRACKAALEAGHACSPDDLAVVYLRETYAQMGLNRPKRPPFRSPFV